MKKVNNKLLVASIIYAVFTLALWIVFFGEFPLFTDEGVNYFGFIFSPYFLSCLGLGIASGYSWFALIGFIFLIVSTAACVLGILKAVGVVPNALLAKLLKALTGVFGLLASLTAVWFAFIVFMSFAPSGTPDMDDIMNMASGLIPFVIILFIVGNAKTVNKHVQDAIAADSATRDERDLDNDVKDAAGDLE